MPNSLPVKVHAFIDEYGDSSLEVENDGVSTHFIIAVVLVQGGDIEMAHLASEEIRSTFFQSGEMKSSKVGSDDKRRMRILSALERVPAVYYLFVVDKASIFRDSGLIYKKSFVKFLHRKVYGRIFRIYPAVSAFADEHGNRTFMDGFQKYIIHHHQPTLFEHSQLQFVSSRESPLIQVADIVAGSAARIFDRKKKSLATEEIFACLKKKIVSIEHWPPKPSQLHLGGLGRDFDEMVKGFCLDQAAIYLEQLNDHLPEDRMREAVILFMYDMASYPDSDHFLPGSVLQSHLRTLGFGEQSIYVLRSKIIAHFRDSGVIVASDPAGYKIPTKVEDLACYVERCDAVIQPMWSRLKQARDQIRMISHNGLDILSRHDFLKSIIDG